MKRGRFSEERIIDVLNEQDTGAEVDKICRHQGIGQATFYAWRNKYGGMEIADARRLKALEEENAKLSCQSACKPNPGSASNFDPLNEAHTCGCLSASEP